MEDFDNYPDEDGEERGDMNEDSRLFENYLEEHFCNMALNSPLFPNAPIGLRFELGLPDMEAEDPSYFNDILFRADRIFNAVLRETGS